MVEIAENHLSLQTLDVGFIAMGLKERALVMLELALEIAFFNATPSTTDVAQVTGLARLKMLDGSLEMELHALLHEG